MFGLRKKITYGLQIFDTGIKLAGLQWHKGEPHLLAFEQAQLDTGVIRNGKIADQQALVSALQSIKKSTSLGKSDVILTIPTTNVLMRRTRIASLKTSEMRNLIDLEMHSSDKLPFKNPVFDFLRIAEMYPEYSQLALSDDSNQSLPVKQEEVIVFATPEESLNGYLEAMKLADISVVSIDIGPLAMFRSLVQSDAQFHPESSDIPDLFMMIECFPEGADVSIFNDGLPVFIRSISISNNNTFATVAERTEHYTKNLITELSRIMNYYKFSISTEFRDITRVYTSGNHSLIESIHQHLSDELKIDLFSIPLDFINEMELGILSDSKRINYCSALGLALKG